MENLLSDVVLLMVAVLIIALTIVMREVGNLLAYKRNQVYDVTRNTKIAKITVLIEKAIEDAVSAELKRRMQAGNEPSIASLRDGIVRTVTSVIGGSAISYIEKHVTDNWDAWLSVKVEAAIVAAKRRINTV